MDFYRFESIFNNYCHYFTKFADQSDPNLKLKKEHSLRVAHEAWRLAQNEKFSARLIYLTRLAGLFHDIGRFEQYIRFKTFRDSDSVDHARLGFKILTRQGLLDSLSIMDSRCVRLAVLFHSKMVIPSGLPADISLTARALRDADKLDIFPVLISHLAPGVANNSVVTLGLEQSEKITPEIFDQVSSGRLGEYSRMRYLNDFKLLICSWAYDLNFSHSRRMVLHRRYIQAVFSLLPKRTELKELQDRILDHLRNGSYLKTTGTR